MRTPLAATTRLAVRSYAQTLLFITSLAGCLGEGGGDPPAPSDLPPQLAQIDGADSSASFPTDASSGKVGRVTQASTVAPSAPLIATATVSPSSVCPGDSVRVDVTTSRPAEVTIDRLPSRARYLQVPGEPGVSQTIHVVALEPKAESSPNVETTTLTVTVKDCGLAAIPQPELAITLGWSATSPVKFTVNNSDALDAVSYSWEFGDGTVETTTVPAVDHIYALASLGYYTQFDTKVTAHTRSGSTSTRKSLLITMPQVFALEQRGIVQPFFSEAFSSGGKQWMGVYNQTDSAMTLTRAEYRYIWCDGQRDPVAAEPGTVSITIPARSKHTWALDGAGGLNGEVPAAVSEHLAQFCSIHGEFLGTTASGGQVQAPFTAILARPSRLTRKVTDPATLSMLEALDARGDLGATHTISQDQLDKLGREKRLPRPITLLNGRADVSGSGNRGEFPQPAVPRPPPILPGFLRPNLDAADLVAATAAARAALNPDAGVCTPGTNERPPFKNHTCQATDGYVEDQPYLANAFAGDIVESSACGTIGSLLRAVQPAQRYTHVGIMTSHNDRIHHSTLNQKRLKDHTKGLGDSNGVVPSVLRYGRPGVLPQTVQEAYEGGPWPDDEYPGEEYVVSGFNEDPSGCETDENLTPPVVLTGAWDRLPDRKRIADEAAEIKGHYRVYGYSRGTIAEDPAYNQPDTERQATVCSTFIWAAARQAGFYNLEGDALEWLDLEYGAFRDESTLDGQYYYTARERRAAAEALYSVIYNKARAQGWGPRGNIDLDGSDNWGNQVVNCFASDFCETSAKDSEAWKETGDGRTVSPDNLLRWDAPLYGQTQPISFQSGQFRRKHVWRAAPGTGTLTATVLTYTGDAAVGAEVVMTGVSKSATAGDDGRAVFGSVKGGCYEVVATQRVGDGDHLVRGATRACVRNGAATDVTIKLAAPSINARKVLARGVLRVHDDEPWPLGGSSQDVGVSVVGTVNPDAPIETETIAKVCQDNEVVVRGTTVRFELREDASVDVVLSASLYEGASCKATDKEDSAEVRINVPRDRQRMLSLKLKSTGVGGGDYATFDLELSNLQDL